jgi:glutathione S-transferase
MLLLQFSTSHYCRKARLALGYKGISYQVKNLTPGLHTLKLKPLTGLTTVPVLLPELESQPKAINSAQLHAIADSTQIFKYLEQYYPQPPLFLGDPQRQIQATLLEDWLDESIGTATRFVYYQFRSGEGKAIDPSLSSQLVIQIVRWQYQMNSAAVEQAKTRLKTAFEVLAVWKDQPYLVGDQISIADLAAAALLSPLALIPEYRSHYPWLFERIKEIHTLCHEPFPPGL